MAEDYSKLAVPTEVWKAMKRVVAASMGIGILYEPQSEETGGVVVSKKSLCDLRDALDEYAKATR